MAAGLAASPLRAQAPAGRLPRIGILTLRRPAEASELQTALLDGLRERGYVDGRTMTLDFPDAEGREDRLAALAAELILRKADVILIVGPAGLSTAHAATKVIPLVMVAASADPVADGVAASFARPGGNVTGLTYAEPDRFKKQLEQLKVAAPRSRRVAVLWDFALDVFHRTWAAPLAAAGRVLGLTALDPVRVSQAGELPEAFAAMRKQQADAFLVASGGILFSERQRVAALALEHRLPGIAAFRQFPEAGLLMSYGPDLADINRRAGGFVDRILRGSSAATMPIELPSKFDLAINTQTAAALGLTIPETLRQRATRLFP